MIGYRQSDGLVPVVVQDVVDGEVLMLGYMNEEAVNATLSTGVVTFFSRSRGRLWVKGESSGHRLELVEMLVDCDADALVVRVRAGGPGTCHNGYRTCFYRRLTPDGRAQQAASPKFDPAAVYGAGAP